MLQMDDALDEFKAAVKAIKADKATASDKAKVKVLGDLNSLNDTMKKLVDRKIELQKCISEISKVKQYVKAYNDQQHQFIKDIKAIGLNAGKITADTKGKDFALIAKDADALQSLNDLESA